MFGCNGYRFLFPADGSQNNAGAYAGWPVDGSRLSDKLVGKRPMHCSPNRVLLWPLQKDTAADYGWPGILPGRPSSFGKPALFDLFSLWHPRYGFGPGSGLHLPT